MTIALGGVWPWAKINPMLDRGSSRTDTSSLSSRECAIIVGAALPDLSSLPIQALARSKSLSARPAFALADRQSPTTTNVARVEIMPTPMEKAEARTTSVS